MNSLVQKVISKMNISLEEYNNLIKDVDFSSLENPSCFKNIDIEVFNDLIAEHDESKFSEEEFEPYAKKWYLDGINTPEYEAAWEHHWTSNRHHWECRQYDECPEDKITKQQILDCIENVCDWMAVGYDKGNRPYQFYETIKDKIKLPKAEQDFMEKVIYEGIDKKYIK